MIKRLLIWSGLMIPPKCPLWGPQCFINRAGSIMVFIHIAEATPHRRLS